MHHAKHVTRNWKISLEWCWSGSAQLRPLQAWVKTDSVIEVLICPLRLAQAVVSRTPDEVGVGVLGIETDGLVD